MSLGSILLLVGGAGVLFISSNFLDFSVFFIIHIFEPCQEIVSETANWSDAFNSSTTRLAGERSWNCLIL
jgi:hypothetical protein